MARDISKGSPSIYRQVDRFSGLFRALLASPVSPDASSTAIRHIIESGTWQLRHLPGPNAAPFVGWRAWMTDEQWEDWNALGDDAWYEAVQRDFGMDARRPQACRFLLQFCAWLHLPILGALWWLLRRD